MRALFDLELNNSKLEVLSGDKFCRIYSEAGVVIKRKLGIVYLGAFLSANGRP